MRRKLIFGAVLIAIICTSVGFIAGYSFGVLRKNSLETTKTEEEKKNAKYVGLWRSQTANSNGSYDSFWLEADGTYISGSARKVHTSYLESGHPEEGLSYVEYTTHTYETNGQTITVTRHAFAAFENDKKRDEYLNKYSDGRFVSSFSGLYGEKVEGMTRDIKDKTYEAIYEVATEEELYTILNDGNTLMAKNGNLYSKMQTE